MAAVYALAGWYANTLQDVGALGPGLWPGAGVAVAGLVFSHRRAWPAILAALVTVQAVSDLVAGYPGPAVVLWSLGNLVGHLAAAVLIVRWRAAELGRSDVVLRFVAAAAVGGLLGGAVGAWGWLVVGLPVAYPRLVAQWLLGDGLGIMVTVPLVAVLAGRMRWPDGRWLEAAAAQLLAAATAAVVLGLPAERSELAALLLYLIIFPVLWVAMRWRVAGASVTIAVVAHIAVIAAALDRGPFAIDAITEGQRFVLLQLLIGAIALVALLLASRSTESVEMQDLAEQREAFVAAVSHELRTPLTPVIGFSELLLERSDLRDPATRRGLEVVHRNAVHLGTLIDRLLLVSRAQRGKLKPVAEPVELVAFVAGYLRERRTPQVQLVASEPAVVAEIDPWHLRQIVGNLLTNADRHGAPPVTVEVGCDLDGGHVELAVVDAGPGVPDEAVDALFAPFQQAGSDASGADAGLGIGLPICRELARANGGDLVHDPGSGPGARFVLRVPAAAT